MFFRFWLKLESLMPYCLPSMQSDFLWENTWNLLALPGLAKRHCPRAKPRCGRCQDPKDRNVVLAHKLHPLHIQNTLQEVFEKFTENAYYEKKSLLMDFKIVLQQSKLILKFHSSTNFLNYLCVL